MIKSSLTTVAAGAAFLATVAIANAYPGEKFAGEAKLTIVQARATALKTVRGTIASEELEPEAGGSGLRYTFDIKTIHGVREVGIDAKTGAILENIAENSEPQSAKAMRARKGAASLPDAETNDDAKK